MDNPRFNEVINDIVQNESEAHKIEPSISLKLETSIQKCFSKSNDNPDKFATCMLDAQKKMKDLTEAFQFKNLFLGTTIQNCLNSSNNVEKCSAEGKTLFKNMTIDLLTQIGKI